MAVSVSASAAAMTSEATKAMQLLRAVIYGSSSAPPPTPPTGNAASWQQQASDDLSSWAGVTLDSSGAKVLELDLSYCSLAVGNGGLAAMRPCLRLLSDIQSLTLTGNEQLTGDLEAFLGILPNLTTLYLDDSDGHVRIQGPRDSVERAVRRELARSTFAHSTLALAPLAPLQRECAQRW